VRQAGDAALVHVHARPGAKNAAIVGLHAGRLKIAIDAPPVDGRANDALVAFLARALGRTRASVHVQSGGGHRDKCVRIDAADAADVARRLQALLPASTK